MASTELIARRWLRLDAGYCAGAGLIVLTLCVPLGRLFHIPWTLVAAIGGATLVWAWLLTRLASRRSWQRQLLLVAAANAGASVGLLVLAIAAPSVAGSVLLVAVAVEVAAFAAVQLRAVGVSRAGA